MNKEKQLASITNDSKFMIEWASAVYYKHNLNEEQKEMSAVIDDWARNIGNSGVANAEISAYLQKTLQPMLDETLEEVVSKIFNIGQIGEFDKTNYVVEPKNTLIAYDSTIGGNVYKSYIDIGELDVKSGFAQIDTQLTYVNLRQNGSKTIAKLTEFAKEALMNKMYMDIFNVLDTVIVGGTNVITESSNSPTLTSMDALNLVLKENAENGDTPLFVTTHKWSQKIARMESFAPFMSDSKKQEYEKFGFAGEFAGNPILSLNSKKQSNGKFIIPEKRIYGFAGVIGDINTRGEIRVYETTDNNSEKLDLKITGLSYEFVIQKPEKVAKINIA